MNKNTKIFIILLITLIAIGITYFLGTQKNNRPTPTQTTDQTTNWKTYTNHNLGLTFKYPQNWIDPVVRPQSTHTEISFDPSDANLSLIVGFDYNQATGKNITYAETVSSASANLKSQADFLLDGIKGKKIIYTMGASTLDILYIVPVPNESSDILKIQYTVPHGDPDTSKLFDQVLSTFKFITPIAGTDTSNWTVYTNKTFGYSLKFPATYYVPSPAERQNPSVVYMDSSVLKRSDPGVPGAVLVVVILNKDNLSLGNFINKNLKLFEITGPLVAYNFNGYDSLLNKNKPGTDVFIKQGQYVYHITAPTASSDKEIGDIVATFKFTQ